jgi:hypothetical protein
VGIPSPLTGVRPRAITLQQLFDLTEAGETLLLAPGLYRSDVPLRLSKPVVVKRDPRFGCHVAPHPLAAAHAADTLALEAARLLQTDVGPTTAITYGPAAATAVVVHTPALKCGGGFGHAAWKAGGTDGGPNGGGGAGGGLGLLQGLTLLCQTLSFCAHSRMAMEDCEVH